MEDSLKKKMKDISLSDLFKIYENVISTKKSVVANKVEITEKDLKPKRKKRGSKN